MKKDVFVDEHERSDVVEDCKKFLNKMEELKLYLVGFNEDGIMKDKTYLSDCVVKGEDCQPVIIISHNKCTFLVNNSIRKVWTRIGDTFLRPKGRRPSIIVSEFLLPFGCLNLFSLFEKKQQEVIEKTGLTFKEAVELFEYGKNNKKYWDGPKLYKQVVTKTLPIAKALYPGYSLLFLFDNAISHSVYADDALCTTGINKGSVRKQVRLCNEWYKKDGIRIKQLMSYQGPNNSSV